MALIPPQYMDCVVAIGVKHSDGKTAWGASGFFYGHKTSGPRARRKKYFVFLITNHHVFKDKAEVFVRCNPIGRRNAKEFRVRLLDSEENPLWVSHENQNIDVAAMLIDTETLRRGNIQFSFFRSDENAANIKDIK